MAATFSESPVTGSTSMLTWLTAGLWSSSSPSTASSSQSISAVW